MLPFLIDIDDLEVDYPNLAKFARASHEFAVYIASNVGSLINCGERYRAGERISSSLAESTWTPSSANVSPSASSAVGLLYAKYVKRQGGSTALVRDNTTLWTDFPFHLMALQGVSVDGGSSNLRASIFENAAALPSSRLIAGRGAAWPMLPSPPTPASAMHWTDDDARKQTNGTSTAAARKRHALRERRHR